MSTDSLWPTPSTSPSRPNEGNVRILRQKVIDGEMTEDEAKAMLNGKSPFDAQGKIPKKLWRTPQAQEAGAKVETLYTKDGQPAKVGERAYRLQPDGRLVLQSQTINQQIQMDGPREPTSSSQLTLLPADSLASLSVSPGSDKAQMMTVTSGLKCLGLSERLDPIGLLQRTLLASSIWASTIVYLTWRTRALKSRRFLYQLVPSTPRTDGIESSLLPTITQFDATCGILPGKEYKPGVNHAVKLGQAIHLWPTPRSEKVEGYSREDFRPTLAQVVTGEEKPLGGQLNPTWVEWLQGFPPGWTDLEPSETP